MGLWEELLQDAMLGGVVLPVTTRRIQGGRDFARKKLPFVGGQEVEDTGRKPRMIEVETELFRDVDEDYYPARYEELIAVLDNDTDQSEVEWHDPVWGPINVKVASWTANEEAESRDGVKVKLTLEETGFLVENNLRVSLLSLSDEGTAEQNGAEFDALIDELAITGGQVETAWEDSGFKKKPGETTSFASQVTQLTSALDAGLQRADQVEALVNRVQARTESVMSLPASRTAAAWEVLDIGARLIDSVAAIGEATVSRQVRIITITTNGPTSVFELANQLYGDASRVDEVLQANPQKRPLFIPAGTRLRVLET